MLRKHLVNAAAAVLLALWTGSAFAGSLTLLGAGKPPGGGGGGNNFSLIAHTSTSINTSPGTTSAIDTTGANLVVVAVSQYSGVTIGTLTDSKGNTWTGLTAQNDGNSYSQIYYCTSCVVGSGHTFTFGNGGPVFASIAVQAWSGANVSQPDVQNGNINASASTLQPGSVTPTNNNSLIVTTVGPGGTTSINTVDSSFTITDNIAAVSGSFDGIALAYLKQNSAAATNPTWTLSGAAAVAATIAVFKP